MSLTLGRQGGVAQPLRKRTVGQTNLLMFMMALIIFGLLLLFILVILLVSNLDTFGVAMMV